MKELIFCLVVGTAIWNNGHFQNLLSDADAELSGLVNHFENYVYKLKHVV
ncbi:hypothetical protein [Vampirovibrio chlorellavorus]|nr:hypothetical protein [Vampirovibrio chlorellavorus]